MRPLNKALTHDGREVTLLLGTRSMTAHEEGGIVSFGNWDAVGGAGDAARRKGGGGGGRPRPTYSRSRVPSATLRELLSEHRVERVELLKMDCEGCEHDAVREMEAHPALTAAFARVTGEVHGCQEPKGRDQMPDKLSGGGGGGGGGGDSNMRRWTECARISTVLMARKSVPPKAIYSFTACSCTGWNASTTTATAAATAEAAAAAMPAALARRDHAFGWGPQCSSAERTAFMGRSWTRPCLGFCLCEY